MSHHSDEVYLAGSDSFWEPGNYKRTTRRIEDGYRLCTDLAALVVERAEIEKMYAQKLKQWAVKWNNAIEKGPEYGTTEAAWKAVLVEADRRGALHNRVKEDLNTKVVTDIKQWQKDTFHKTMMSLKEKKEMDDTFKKAQKPWAKLYQKVQKAKAEYHNACKTERSYINQERNAAGDSTISPDTLKKLQDRVAKSKESVNRTRDAYKADLQDLNRYNPQYVENMTEVFERCQMSEAQRLQKFKETLFSLQKVLNVAEYEDLPQIYEEFYHTVNNADHDKDLRLWSNTHGVNMAMNWPQFEEYTEELRDITGGKGGKGSKATQIADGNITLINQRSVGDDLPEYNSVVKQQNGNGGGGKQASRNGGSRVSNSSSNSQQQQLTRTANNAAAAAAGGSNGSNYPPQLSNGGGSKESNPFDEEEEEWDDGGGGGGGGAESGERSHEALVDNGEPGVKVRALYDYDAAEEDEIEFKIGDVFEKLEDEDEQGWCKGRKDGRVGLYPANYVEMA